MLMPRAKIKQVQVALLAEGVDRNTWKKTSVKKIAVALLAEGVDRNFCGTGAAALPGASPSSRRAWIEIGGRLCLMAADTVALLAEGVDRNKLPESDKRKIWASPSSRRAWIEIISLGLCPKPKASPSSRRAWIEICYRR